MRHLAVMVTAALLLVGIASPAVAGGVWIEFPEAEIEPGDQLVGMAGVNWSIDVTRWEHLGAPSDGPYFAWLHPVDIDGTPVPTDGWPEPGWVVGVVEPVRGSMWVDGDAFGPDHVVLAIEVPAIPAGRYAVTIQNGSKTIALGDLLGSLPFVVDAGSGGRLPADVQADVYRTVETRIASYAASLEAGYAAEAPFLLTDGPGPSIVAPPVTQAGPEPVTQLSAPDRVDIDADLAAALGSDAPTDRTQPALPDPRTPGATGEPLDWSAVWVFGAVVVAAGVLGLRASRRPKGIAIADEPRVLVDR